MNCTDIYVISTIANILLVGALAFTTCYYAYQVKKQTEFIKKQTEFMEKDRERNKILEGIRYVLTPSIHIIKGEINKITNGTRIDYFVQKFNKFFVRKRYYSYAFEDIIEESTNLPEKLHSNDELADKLNTSYDKIEKEVTNQFKNDKFNERLTNMLHDFYQLNPNVFGTEKEALPNLENLCKEYIINPWDLSNNVPRVSEHKNNFLKENKDELQRYMELPKIKELCKQIKNTLNALEKSDEDILERFEKIIKRYREDYHFTEDEINPGIKQERDSLNKRA